MILRLLRASLRPEDVPTVVAALRAEADAVRAWPGILSWTHGLRREGDVVHGLTVSAWADYESLLRVANGSPDRDVSQVWRTGVLREVSAEHFELTHPTEPADVTLDGEVLGVIHGLIRPNVEAAVQDMVRAVLPTISAAGVRTLYVGRRVVEQRTEIVVIAAWRDRLSLHEFARSRPVGAIDPAFTSQLDDWRFETYNSLPPDRLAEAPPASPAVLVFDDQQRCVDATPGVEAVVGIPGELLVHRTLGEILAPEARRSIGRRWRAATTSGGELELRIAPWPGAVVAVRGELRPNAPRDGLHTIVLEAQPSASRRRRPGPTGHT